MRRVLILTALSLLFGAGGAAFSADAAHASKALARASIHQIGKAHSAQIAFQGYGRAPAARTDQPSPNGTG